MMGQARNGLQTRSTKHCEPQKDQVYLQGGIPEIVGYETLVCRPVSRFLFEVSTCPFARPLIDACMLINIVQY